jgi:hypothetical protein
VLRQRATVIMNRRKGRQRGGGCADTRRFDVRPRAGLGWSTTQKRSLSGLGPGRSSAAMALGAWAWARERGSVEPPFTSQQWPRDMRESERSGRKAPPAGGRGSAGEGGGGRARRGLFSCGPAWDETRRPVGPRDRSRRDVRPLRAAQPLETEEHSSAAWPHRATVQT